MKKHLIQETYEEPIGSSSILRDVNPDNNRMLEELYGATLKNLSEITEAKKEIEKTKNITYLGFIISLLMVATLLATVAGIVIDAYRFKSSSYIDLKNQVQILTDEIHKQKGFR